MYKRQTTRCVTVAAPTVTGLDVLEASGLDVLYEIQANGAAICKIEDVGCDIPRETCFCQHVRPPFRYWSYWQLSGETWTSSPLGAGSSTVTAGSVEGWSWSTGSTTAPADTPPPQITYAEICEPEQVATATAAAASAATATAVAQATSAVQPTATPTDRPSATPTPETTPQEPPLITYLAPDRQRIIAGESVQLTWETIRATSVKLVADGSEQGLALNGTLVLTPGQTTTYWLHARNDAGEDRVDVTIAVDPAPSTGTADAAATDVTPTEDVAPPTNPTASGGANAAPTSTSDPIAATPTWTSTPIVVAAPTATATPIVVAAPTQPTVPATAAAPQAVAQATLAETVPAETPMMTPTMTPTPTVANTPSPASGAIVQADGPIAVEMADFGEARLDLDGSAVADAQARRLRSAFLGLSAVLLAPLLLGGLAFIFLRLRKPEAP